MFRAELTKLRRSSTWIVALILPILAVVTGTVNLATNVEVLDSGWGSFTSQVVLFYGMIFYSMGISLLTATVWRVEHRGTNWNLVLTSTVGASRLSLAKIAVVLLPTAVMQGVLVAGTAVSGTFVLHLPGPFPWEFAVVGLVAVVAALPLIAVQSLLSMLLRSFAVPVALCLVGCVVGVAALTSTALHPLGYVLPQAITTRALNLGSTAIVDSGSLTVDDALPIVLTALALAAALTWLTVVALRIVKLR